jgi:tRNA threonylcarbamoyladenosine biosynthesis protein TsaE
MKRYQSYSSAETKKFAGEIAHALIPRAKSRGATVITLSGELGAGKTTFVKGFTRGLGSRARVVSPTFVLIRRHAIHQPLFTNLFHLDAYRLKSAKDLTILGFKKILADSRNIVLIEWPERVSRALPKQHIRIAFTHGKKENENERVIVVSH